MSGIVLSQPNGAGILNAAGAQHPAPFTLDAGIMCALSFTGASTRYRWVLTKPAASASVLSSTTSAGPSFLPDVEDGSYSISLFDINEVEYVLDIVTATSGAGGAGGSGGAVATTVNTYAELRSAATFAPSVPPATVTLKCRAMVNDGGGGLFAYDAADTSSADNDGTLLVSSAGARYKRIHANHINVKWFGAKGDGTTDDRAAAQAAIDYAQSLAVSSTVPGQGVTYARAGVFFPCGKYVFSKRPTFWHCLELPPAMGIYGETGTMFGVVDADKFTAQIVMMSCFKNTVKDIIFTDGFSALGLCGVASTGTYGAAVGIEVNRIDHCEFYRQVGPSICQNVDGDVALVRSIQAPILVTNYRHQGPHLFWGVGDNVRFRSGAATMDQWNPPQIGSPPFPDPVVFDSQDFPLGYINTAGHFFWDGVMCAPNGVGGEATVDPRICWVVGSGEINIAGATQFDLAFPLLRIRTSDNEFQHPGWAAAHLLAGGDDTGLRAQINVQDTYTNCIAKNWLEVYDYFPSTIVFKGNDDGALDGCFGIFVHEDVDTTEILQRHGFQLCIKSDQLLGTRALRIRQGADGYFDDELGGVDITGLFISRWEESGDRKAGTLGQQDNLFLPDSYASGSLQSAGGGAADAANTETGYTLQTWTSAANDEMSFVTPDWGALGYPAGTYTFSCYVRFTADVVLRFGYQLDGDAGAQLAARRVAPSPHWQRVEFPFYYPGGVSLKITCNSSPVPTGKQSGNGLYMINQGLHAAPYVYPLDSSVSPTDPGWAGETAGGLGTANSFVRSTYYRNAIPTAGVYYRGDRIVRPSPAPGTAKGYVCVTPGAGTDAAWEPMYSVDDPTLLTKDVTAGGAIVLSEDDSAHERIKFTGSPGGALSVEVKAGAGTGWVRTFWNASGKTVTVKGSSGDSGVTVLNGDTVNVFSDGTNARPTDGSTFGAISRVARGTPWFSNAAEWAINDDGHAVAQVNTDSFAYWVLDVPHGSLITTVTAFLSGTGHGALPASMPVLTVHEHTISTNGTSTAGTATDGSGSTGVYDAAHVIDAAVSITVDNVDHRYVAILRNEHGANAQVGLDVYMIMVSFTPAAPDRGAA